VIFAKPELKKYVLVMCLVLLDKTNSILKKYTPRLLNIFVYFRF